LGFVVSNDSGNPARADCGITIAHEFGHVLCLRHRNTRFGSDLLPMPRIFNLMSEGNAAGDDFDLIQLIGVLTSPVLPPP
jgi:hypothetical protein